MNVPKKPPTHAHVALRQTPRVLQPKTVPPRPQVKRPAAPLAYRPQPVPKVLQTKTAVVQQPPLNQPQRKPVAPPVYRPEQKRIVQPKVMSRPQNPHGAHLPSVPEHLAQVRQRLGANQNPRQMPKPTSPRSHGAAIQRAEAAPSLASAESRYVAKDNIVVSTGPMHTNNLFNCIAVVAYHEDSENAAFTHYDTIFAFGREPTGEEDEYGNDEYRSKLNVNALKQLKKDLLGKLNQTAGVDFYIVLGVVWKDERINQNEDDKRKKGELIEGLREVFNPVNMATGGTETAHWSRSDFASLL